MNASKQRYLDPSEAPDFIMDFFDPETDDAEAVMRRVLTLDLHERRQHDFPLYNMMSVVPIIFPDVVIKKNPYPFMQVSMKETQRNQGSCHTDLPHRFKILLKLMQQFPEELFLAGGAVSKLFMKSKEWHEDKDTRIRGDGDYDYDLFLVNHNVEVLEEKRAIEDGFKLLNAVVTALTKLWFKTEKDSPMVFMTRGTFVTTLYLTAKRHIGETVVHADGGEHDGEPVRGSMPELKEFQKVQIIHRVYPSPGAILGGFDHMSSCVLMRHDGNIYGSSRGYWSHQNKILILDLSRRSTTFEKRAIKASRLFKIWLPGLPGNLRSTTFRLRKSEVNDFYKKEVIAALLRKKPESVGELANYDVDKGLLIFKGTQAFYDVQTFVNGVVNVNTVKVFVEKVDGAATTFKMKFIDKGNTHIILPRMTIKKYTSGGYEFIRNNINPDVKYGITEYDGDQNFLAVVSKPVTRDASDYEDYGISPTYVPYINANAVVLNKLESVLSLAIIASEEHNFSVNGVQAENPDDNDMVREWLTNTLVVNDPKDKNTDYIGPWVDDSYHELNTGPLYLARHGKNHVIGKEWTRRRLVVMASPGYKQVMKDNIGKGGKGDQFQENLIMEMMKDSIEKKFDPKKVAQVMFVKNAGRQWTSSINPIVEHTKMWYGPYCNGRVFTLGNCEVETLLRLIRKTGKSHLSRLNNDLFRYLMGIIMLSY